MATPPTLVPYNLSSVLALRRKIHESSALREFINSQLSRADFHDFADKLCRLLPGKAPSELVADSLRHLAGRTLDDDLLWEIACVFSGNLRRLRALQLALPWSGQKSPEWVPVQIIRGDPGRTKRTGVVGTTFKFQVLAGTACPFVLTKFWSRAFCGIVARRLGFTRVKGAYPFQNPLQLVNTRLYVLIDPVKCRDKPDFEQVAEKQPGSAIRWNRKLARTRARRPGEFECPRNYPRTLRCVQCHVGYFDCPAGAHPETYVRRDCARCSRSSWHESPESRYCVDCEANLILHPPNS